MTERPTVRRIAAPAVSETTLFRAYGAEVGPGDVALFRVSRGEAPCVCGGTVTVSGRAIRASIDVHNATPKHVAWRAWREA